MKTQQKGFTLIELIIVIVVLGILAVTAAPQFFNFSSDARASTVKGMEGSVKAASALVYAKALLSPDASTVSVDQFNTQVALKTGTQYAAATDPAGITAALDMSDFDAVVVDPAAAVTATAKGVKKDDLLIYPADIDVNADGTPLCYVVYRAAAVEAPESLPGAGDAVDAAAPVIFSVTDDC